MFSLHRADLARSLLKDSMLTDLKFLLVTVLTLASGFMELRSQKQLHGQRKIDRLWDYSLRSSQIDE